MCPVAGIAVTAYQAGKKSTSENKPGESASEREKKPDENAAAEKSVSPSFAQKMKSLVTSMGKRCASITKIFAKTRKAQEKQVEAFEKVIPAPSAEDISNAFREYNAKESDKVNEELKKKQEEAGLETENLKK